MKVSSGVGTVFTLLIAVAFISCTKSTKTEVGEITPLETMGMLRNDFAVLVDVREKSEIEETGMAEGARWMPESEIRDQNPRWEKFVESLPRGKEIVVYSDTGRRAGEVAERLAEKGFKVSKMGGFSEWKKAGLPVKDVKALN